MKFQNAIELSNAKEYFKTLAKQTPSIKGHRIVAIWVNSQTHEIYKVTNTSFGQFQNYIKWLSAPEQRLKQAWNNYCSRQKRYFKGFVSYFPEDTEIEIMLESYTSIRRADECEAKFKAEQSDRLVRMKMPASPLMSQMVGGKSNDNFRTYKELVTKETYDRSFSATH
jgi:hypothetical protein